MRRYYQILGVRPDATQDEIKEAWNFGVKAFHPDKFAGSSQRQQAVAQERTKAINEAYSVLSNPIKRAHYDREYARETRTETTPPPPPRPAPPPPGRQSGTGPSTSGRFTEPLSKTKKCFERLFPHQKETCDKWWHRLAKVAFISICIIMPPFIWEKSTVPEFDGCFHSFLTKPSGRGYPILIEQSAEDYQPRQGLYEQCIANAKEAGLTLIVIAEVMFIVASNILYYRVIFHVAFGRRRTSES